MNALNREAEKAIEALGAKTPNPGGMPALNLLEWGLRTKQVSPPTKQARRMMLEVVEELQALPHEQAAERLFGEEADLDPAAEGDDPKELLQRLTVMLDLRMQEAMPNYPPPAHQP